MNQTRTFLIFAWLMVATLLWMEWGKEQQPAKPAMTTAAAASATPNGLPPPDLGAAIPSATAVPAAGAPATPAVSAAPAAAQAITLGNDVLRLTLDGGNVRRAELLNYRTKKDPAAPYVRLFDDNADTFYIAQSGWASDTGAPNHLTGFVPEQTGREFLLAKDADSVSAAFRWTGTNGVEIRRIYSLKRGEYVLTVRDEIANRGAAPWKGHVYRQLARVPHDFARSMTNPETFSFNGAAWYTPAEKYEKRGYDAFVDDGRIDPIDRNNVAGGWIALQQHYFFSAWIPQPDQAANFSIAQNGSQYGIAASGPVFTVAPGTNNHSEAKLWIGPKLQDRMQDVAPGLKSTLDYGVFAFIAEPIHWTLTQLHKFTRNWGWAIVLLVLLIKIMLYPLSAAQYRSAAKMRKFQPRIQQLKERYGEDKQKMQMAMLELYKKEKINPAGGCLPILLTMPVFLALYWVLIEAVELRQAPWMLWITDLTARDPFFILPILNMAVMWYTQKLTPMVGVDPMQAKMMQMMPLIFGVMFAFFPAGLVLYWVTNGALGLLQQWWMLRQSDKETAKTVS